MINYTKVLFDKILREEPDIELEKSERMENIINSLNSISSMDQREAINQLHLDPQQFIHLAISSTQSPVYPSPPSIW
jgi:signal transduction histidine kinase